VSNEARIDRSPGSLSGRDTPAIRVLIAEDEEPLRNAIRDLVAGEPGLEVVGAVASADEAIALAAREQPDVALLDVRMPGGGPRAARGIKEQSPETRLVALSAYEDQATVVEMLRSGAVGYLVKGIAAVEVVEAVRRAARGQASIAIDVITRAIDDLVNDMEERRQGEDEVRRSEHRFRALLESAPDAVAIADETGTIVLVNEQTERLFGYGRDELVGNPIEILLPERFRVRHVGHRTGYFADPRTRPMGVNLELAGRRRDGSEFPVDISLSAIETEEGRLATAFIRDTTERTAAEEVRRRGDERFASLLDSAPDAVVIVDGDGGIVLVNSQTEELFGYDRQDLLGQKIETLLPERFHERHVGHRQGYLDTPETRKMGIGLELAGRRGDGSEFPVDISLSAIETDEGRLVTAFVRDITERRAGEIAMRQLAAIVESSDDAIIGKKLDGTILSWNAAAERIYGYGADEVIGRPISLLVPPEHLDELPEIIERLRRGEEIDELETKRVRKDGHVIDVALRISAVRNAGGSLIGASTIARDVTEAKGRAEREREHVERRALLAHLVAAAEEERARIAGDIHDDSIQAITAAGMRLQIMRKSLDDPVQLAVLDELEETIQLSIARLRHLLFELRPPVLDNEGLSAAVEMYLREAEDQGETRYRLDDKLTSQPSLETRTILYRIIQEALTNVRKHARASTATVSLRERDEGYAVRVSDDGGGFAGGSAAAEPGHLGLASMRERATLAGGWLRVDAVPSEGTTVEAWIPRLPEQDPGIENASPDAAEAA
jgi:PAS domain S-box-containing protein